jgi:hypothetical protein
MNNSVWRLHLKSKIHLLQTSYYWKWSTQPSWLFNVQIICSSFIYTYRLWIPLRKNVKTLSSGIFSPLVNYWPQLSSRYSILQSWIIYRCSQMWRGYKEGEPQPLFACKTSELQCTEGTSQRYTISILPLTESTWYVSHLPAYCTSPGW